MFSKKDYDYSKKAKFQHAQNLAQMDHAERCGVRVSLGQLEAERFEKVNKHAIKLLMKVFASADLDERIGTWQDFRSWVNTNGLNVQYSHLKKMIKIWEVNKGQRKVA